MTLPTTHEEFDLIAKDQTTLNELMITTPKHYWYCVPFKYQLTHLQLIDIELYARTLIDDSFIIHETSDDADDHNVGFFSGISDSHITSSNALDKAMTTVNLYMSPSNIIPEVWDFDDENVELTNEGLILSHKQKPELQKLFSYTEICNTPRLVKHLWNYIDRAIDPEVLCDKVFSRPHMAHILFNSVFMDLATDLHIHIMDYANEHYGHMTLQEQLDSIGEYLFTMIYIPQTPVPALKLLVPKLTTKVFPYDLLFHISNYTNITDHDTIEYVLTQQEYISNQMAWGTSRIKIDKSLLAINGFPDNRLFWVAWETPDNGFGHDDYIPAINKYLENNEFTNTRFHQWVVSYLSDYLTYVVRGANGRTLTLHSIVGFITYFTKVQDDPEVSKTEYVEILKELKSLYSDNI